MTGRDGGTGREGGKGEGKEGGGEGGTILLQSVFKAKNQLWVVANEATECPLEKRSDAKTKLGQRSSFRFLPEKEKQVRIISFSVWLHTNTRTHLIGSGETNPLERRKLENRSQANTKNSFALPSTEETAQPEAAQSSHWNDIHKANRSRKQAGLLKSGHGIIAYNCSVGRMESQAWISLFLSLWSRWNGKTKEHWMLMVLWDVNIRESLILEVHPFPKAPRNSACSGRFNQLPEHKGPHSPNPDHSHEPCLSWRKRMHFFPSYKITNMQQIKTGKLEKAQEKGGGGITAILTLIYVMSGFKRNQNF
jgi:hypothetical protein